MAKKPLWIITAISSIMLRPC